MHTSSLAEFRTTTPFLHSLCNSLTGKNSSNIIFSPKYLIAGPPPFHVLTDSMFEFDGHGRLVTFSYDIKPSLLTSTLSEFVYPSQERPFYIELKKERKQVVIDGGMIIPSLINSHVHSADGAGAGAGFAKSLDYSVGISGMKYHYSNNLTCSSDIQSYVNLSSLYGVSSIFDFREGGLSGVNHALKARNYCNSDLVILGRPDSLEDGTLDQDSLEMIIDTSDGFGIPDVVRYDEDDLILLHKIAEKKKKPIFVHAGENRITQSNSQEKYDMSEVAVASSLLNADVIVHGVICSKSDFSLLRKEQSGLVLCPQSNSFFSDGEFPLATLLECINSSQPTIKNTGLGTDNAFQSSPSIFNEVKFSARAFHILTREQSIPNISITELLYFLWKSAWCGPLNSSFNLPSCHLNLSNLNNSYRKKTEFKTAASKSGTSESRIRNRKKPLLSQSSLLIRLPKRIHESTTLLHYLTFQADELSFFTEKNSSTSLSHLHDDFLNI